MRRAVDDGKKVGHTGTLDPLASGVLPLVLGKATRLAQFLSSAEKEYEAEIELGVTTTTLDRGGEIVARAQTREVSRSDAIAHRGGRRRISRHLSAAAARLLRQENRRRPSLRSRAQERARTPATGEGHGDGARRARLARQPASRATGLLCRLLRSRPRRRHRRAAWNRRSSRGSRPYTKRRLLPGARGRPRGRRSTAGGSSRARDSAGKLLPSLPAITLTAEGASLAARGGFIGPAHVERGATALPGLSKGARVRLLHPDGRLVAIAEPRAGGGSAGLRVIFASGRGTGIKLLVWDSHIAADWGVHSVAGHDVSRGRKPDGRLKSTGPHAEVTTRGFEQRPKDRAHLLVPHARLRHRLP